MTITDRASAPATPAPTTPVTTVPPVDVDSRVVALTRACGPRVLAYLTRRCPEREDAADLFGETLTVLWRRRDDVPGDDQELLRLDAWDGLTGEQIGRVLGISAPAARQRLARARARLRAVVGRTEGDQP